jgi:hypothetical protein
VGLHPSANPPSPPPEHPCASNGACVWREKRVRGAKDNKMEVVVAPVPAAVADPAAKVVAEPVPESTAAGHEEADPAAAEQLAAEKAARKAVEKAALHAEIFSGTAMARRTGGTPKSEYIQKRKPTIRKKTSKPTVEYVLDLGQKLGACWRCTCPVHEADIADGYAEACAQGFECIQSLYADSCQEYAASHQAEVAAARAALVALVAAAAEAPSSPTAAATTRDDGPMEEQGAAVMTPS